MAMLRLPIGLQGFSEIRTGGYAYVDKTPFIAELESRGTYYFLSRPRRFGKSLFVDTLDCAFSCRRELFSGLFLDRPDSGWDWKRSCPVLRLDFAGGTIASRADLDARLLALVPLLSQAKGEKLVILVDEYDKPILDNLERPETAADIRDSLRDFYGAIKPLYAFLRFILDRSLAPLVLGLLLSGALWAVPPLPPAWNPSNSSFRAFYGAEGLDWKWSRIRSGPYDIAIHELALETRGEASARAAASDRATPRGTAFVVHGYLEHAGTQVPLVRTLLGDGWRVVAIDLPGHGLSSGARADIADFSEYGAVLLAVEDSQAWPKPWRAVGHSTGCAAILSAEAQRLGSFEAIFFQAPLIRSWAWEPSVLGYTLFSWLIGELPGRSGASSRDGDFNHRTSLDPLFIRIVPFHWVGALIRFQDEVAAMGSFSTPLTLMQGTGDTVVDSPHNVPLLEKLFPNHSTVMIPGAWHSILWDIHAEPAWDCFRAFSAAGLTSLPNP
jgi:alpha-beta hydrolase superfamily lysophospholipase